MDGLLGRRNDREKPLVHVRIQSSFGEAGRMAVRLHHDTNDFPSPRIDADNYDRMVAKIARTWSS